MTDILDLLARVQSWPTLPEPLTKATRTRTLTTSERREVQMQRVKKSNLRRGLAAGQQASTPDISEALDRVRAAAEARRALILEKGLEVLVAKARAAEEPVEKAAPEPLTVNVTFPREMKLTSTPTETVAERGENGLVKRSITRPLTG